MKDAMRQVLLNKLRDDTRVTLYGEDIEDPKGDVFGITRGLSSQFPGRVMNSPLSESTIIGASIGRAMAGERPVAFLQFADFMPQAYNQIVSELSTIHWRSDGKWSAPVAAIDPGWDRTMPKPSNRCWLMRPAWTSSCPPPPRMLPAC
jgi:2-oxoisovalerate dehydrogenase E1 component